MTAILSRTCRKTRPHNHPFYQSILRLSVRCLYTASQVLTVAGLPVLCYHVHSRWHTPPPPPVPTMRSFSVDIRIGNVLQSKWICEALFNGLLAEFHSPVEDGTGNPVTQRAVCPADLVGDAFSQGGNGEGRSQILTVGVRQQLQYIISKGGELLQRCRMPRCFPFLSSHCDGLHRGGTLEFLAGYGFCCADIDMTGMVGLNDMVAVTFKLRDHTTLIVQMFAESLLSTAEYFRYSLYCHGRHHDRVRRLRDEGCVPLLSLCEGLFTADSNASGEYQEFQQLLRVLLYGNILYWMPGRDGVDGVPAAAKRSKTS